MASYGDASNIPKDVMAAANLRHDVLAWQKIDDANADTLPKYICCTSVGPLLAMPCFWPHLCSLTVVCGGCVCAQMRTQVEATTHNHWVLTERELLIVTTDYGNGYVPIHCVALYAPPCTTSGNNVKSIPLENITDISTDMKGQNCFQACVPDYAYMSVDTASNSSEGTLVGFDQSFDLRSKILDARDAVKEGRHAAPVAMAVARGDDGKSAKEKIKDLKEMLDDDLITQAEFDEKKAALLAQM